jgi:predicted 2-oxoglutarate/Fe(II)-dependent dioxygenase YbiX
MARSLLSVGEPAPWFAAPSASNPRYHFDSVAGRHVVLCFFASANVPISQQVLKSLFQQRSLFDDSHCCFFGVSIDPEDRAQARLEQLPPLNHAEPAAVQAPVLVVPRVFEPDLCQALIDYYNQHGGAESGFMREVGGRTVAALDHSFKRRKDQEILDDTLRNAAMYRICDRLSPEIAKAFQFRATRIERHIVACYDSHSGGFFRPHRDNTTKGTAHRRFAVSLNLNAGEYEGGKLRFPEFGRRTYESPAGGAVVFSCSLLHEATPVTQGLRYAYLPFLYDDAAAKIREENLQFLAAE